MLKSVIAGRTKVGAYIKGIQVDKDDVLSIEVEKAVSDRMTTEEVILLLDKLIEQDGELNTKLENDLKVISDKLQEVSTRIGVAQTVKTAREALESTKDKLKVEEPKVKDLEGKLKLAKKDLSKRKKLDDTASKIDAELPNYDIAINKTE
ncbi:hypothetical protein [Pseudobutyrivibrio ruminis]|uniref:hypothetical protein n=1 Tax=Pseudobutyrivibrio ruminis TaxID=46206 RepID=UPI00068D1F25|nr:hypothetical protein [Pseudobutyrivibrio ruminis]